MGCAIVGQLGRVTLNTAKVPAQMEKQRRRERMEEAMKEAGARGDNSLMARVLAQVELCMSWNLQLPCSGRQKR